MNGRTEIDARLYRMGEAELRPGLRPGQVTYARPAGGQPFGFAAAPSREDFDAILRSDATAIRDYFREQIGILYAKTEAAIRDYAEQAHAKGKVLAVSPIALDRGTVDDPDPTKPHVVNAKFDFRLLEPGQAPPAGWGTITKGETGWTVTR